jgi:two-component system OmpR family sensor kinase
MDTIEVVALIYEISIAYVIGSSVWQMRTREVADRGYDVSSVISDIAHSIQTPLTVACLECDLLSKEYGKRKRVVSIHNSLMRISECIERMIEVARLEGGVVYTCVVFDFSSLVQDEVEYIATMGLQYGVSVTWDVLPEIYIKGDKKCIREAILNILHNAVKYRRPGVVGTLHLMLKKKGNGCECICIDNGRGIAPEHIPYIFDKLYRISSEIPGYGLGLAFVKAVVHFHQGTIHVSSTFGKGTTFTLWLPSCKKPPYGDNIQKVSPQILS